MVDNLLFAFYSPCSGTHHKSKREKDSWLMKDVKTLALKRWLKQSRKSTAGKSWLVVKRNPPPRKMRTLLSSAQRGLIPLRPSRIPHNYAGLMLVTLSWAGVLPRLIPHALSSTIKDEWQLLAIGHYHCETGLSELLGVHFDLAGLTSGNNVILKLLSKPCSLAISGSMRLPVGALSWGGNQDHTPLRCHSSFLLLRQNRCRFLVASRP